MHNRISNIRFSWEGSSLELRSIQKENTPARQLRSMAMVPLLAPQASWQNQLYRMAYEKAVADLTPPRHFDRFFSVWN